MFRLVCTVEPGVFSHERLVHFADADGQPQSALVDEDFVRVEHSRTWLEVNGTADGENVIVALPNDGSRVRVPSASVEAAS